MKLEDGYWALLYLSYSLSCFLIMKITILVLLVLNVLASGGSTMKSCNSTIEFGLNTEIRLVNPKHSPGNSLDCWYKLKKIDGAAVECTK